MDSLQLIAECYDKEEADYIITLLKKKNIDCTKREAEKDGFHKITLFVSEDAYAAASCLLKEAEEDGIVEDDVTCVKCASGNVTTEGVEADAEDETLFVDHAIYYVCKDCDHRWIIESY